MQRKGLSVIQTYFKERNEVNLGNPIAKGNTAEIYLTDDKVVKLFKDYLPDTESMNEAKKKICLFMRAASSKRIRSDKDTK